MGFPKGMGWCERMGRGRQMGWIVRMEQMGLAIWSAGKFRKDRLFQRGCGQMAKVMWRPL